MLQLCGDGPLLLNFALNRTLQLYNAHRNTYPSCALVCVNIEFICDLTMTDNQNQVKNEKGN